MTDLEGLIHYWEAKLKDMRVYISPAEAALIESTIRKPQELKKIQESLAEVD
ncbi:unnamed protein product, partial [marine sediment metagenome]